jgi:hypothetical protein
VSFPFGILPPFETSLRSIQDIERQLTSFSSPSRPLGFGRLLCRWLLSFDR